MAFKIGIVEASDFSIEAYNLLSSIGEVSFFNDEEGELSYFISDKDCLFVRLRYFWDEQLLGGAARLKYLCSPTTGLNHVDENYLQQRKIRLISLKGENEFLRGIPATAEHSLGLALALLRNYQGAFLNAGHSQWDRDNYKGYEICGLDAGIIGLGRVGNMLAKYLNAFGADVFFYDIDDQARNDYNARRLDTMESLIDSVTMVFLCASYHKENDGILDRSCIDRLKGKYLVNTSRGELVDEAYLIQCIKNDHFAGVALDVIQDETGAHRASQFAQLAQAHKLIVTPHIAGATYPSMWKTEIYVSKKLLGAMS